MSNIYIHIKSEYLQLAEPFMEKYYDYHPTMFMDEMRYCVENSGINYMNRIDDILTVDYDKSFRERFGFCRNNTLQRKNAGIF